MPNRTISFLALFAIVFLFNSEISANAAESDASVCKIATSYRSETNIGFPRSPYRLPATGELHPILFFVEFSDAPKSGDPIALGKKFTVNFEKYIYAESYGKLTVKSETYPKFIRLSEKAASYKLTQDGRGDGGKLVSDVINAIDSEIDFSRYDLPIVLTPPGNNKIYTSGALASWDGFVSQEKKFSSVVYVGAEQYAPEKVQWAFLAHETGHLLGLLHPYAQPKNSTYQAIAWDLMGNGATFAQELLGWHRFYIGWIADEEIVCLGTDSTGKSVHNLMPLYENVPGRKLIVAKINSTKVVVVESRRATRYDKIQKADEGALVYLVDSQIRDDRGAVRIIPGKITVRNGHLIGTLKKGDQVKVEGITVKVISSTSAGEIIQVIRLTSR